MSIGTQPCPTNLPGCRRVKNRSSAQCINCYKISQQQSRKPVLKPTEQIIIDLTKRRKDQELSSLKRNYSEALKTIERQGRELKSINVLGDSLETFTIQPVKGQGTSEGTVVLVASDWHIEEKVGSEVGGLNKYNIEIAKKRATQFFQSGLRLTNLLAQDIAISTMVLPLLGDFISNDIHEEFTDITEQLPTNAIVTAQGFLISGIEFLLKNSTLKLVIPCHSGNHARTTRTTRFAVENGHSLEYLMYLHLAAYFRNEPRVQFVISEGPHSYVQIYDLMVRFQHGHMVKYNGGVGGIYIPVLKAINQWNKARHADLDVFGHFHQLRDGGNFICNGSLIGYNAFALSLKADFEKPKQTLFLIDRKRGRTCLWPILVD